MKVVINKCYGGFGLSDAAYEKLAEWGVPIRKYLDEPRGENGLYQKVSGNEGEVIFDRELTPPEADSSSAIYHEYKGKSRFQQRYWETWIRSDHRADPRIVRLVEEMGEAANGPCAELTVVEIPDGVEWEIEEYDGREWVAEKHRSWA